MIRIAVCDDEPAITGKIENMLLDLSDQTNTKLDIDVFFDGDTLEDSMEQGNEYQIIYLDVEMKRRSGIDVGKTLRNANNESLIIYVSSYEIYAKELFEVDAFRFMSKPVNETKFRTYFLQAVNKLSDQSEYYEFVYKREKYRVQIKDIMYFESCKRIINISMIDHGYSFYGKMKDVENYMNVEQHHFLRAHQSYLVNYNHIKIIGSNYIELMNGNRIQMSEDRQKKIKQEYCRILGCEVI